MSAITASVRAGGWNVILTIDQDIYFAGIFQNPRKPTVTFGDVCRDEGTDQVQRIPWTDIAFALTETPDEVAESDPTSYPTFITRQAFDTIVPGLFSPHALQRRHVKYRVVHHGQLCTLPAGSLQDHMTANCADLLLSPKRYHHPSYLPHNKGPSDPRLKTMPLRNKLTARSKSPKKRTASESASPEKDDDTADNNDYNDIMAPDLVAIDMDAAKRLNSDFRPACINRSTRCAVSGLGDPWCIGQLIGPGIQACHIVPQQHYHLYPLRNQNDLAAQHDLDPDRLRLAWESTWSSNNGILLSKQLHECFDARLFSIHPTTLRIRVFVPYGLLEQYHGQKAQLSVRTDRHALAYHYDMCCIENMAAEKPSVAPPAAAGAASKMSTPATNIGTLSSGSSTPFSDRTGLSGTSALAATVLPKRGRGGDPSKRQRQTQDVDDEGQADNDEDGGSDDEHVKRGRKRRRQEHYDNVCLVTRSNLGLINQELLCSMRF